MADTDSKLEFSTVLASTVHDMKNSLSMLLNTLDLIIEQSEPETFPAYDSLAQLQYEGRRVNNNLIQLLTLYRVDNSSYAPNYDEYTVAEFLEELLMDYQVLLAPKGITVDADCPDDLEWVFDRDLVGGVLNNVVNNAYRYTRSHIRVSARVTADGMLAITVDDDGPGYPATMLHTGAEAQKAVNFKSGSTGLGLYFASIVAQLHENRGRHGSIATTNDAPDGGGRFTLFLP